MISEYGYRCGCGAKLVMWKFADDQAYRCPECKATFERVGTLVCTDVGTSDRPFGNQKGCPAAFIMADGDERIH